MAIISHERRRREGQQSRLFLVSNPRRGVPEAFYLLLIGNRSDAGSAGREMKERRKGDGKQEANSLQLVSSVPHSPLTHLPNMPAPALASVALLSFTLTASAAAFITGESSQAAVASGGLCSECLSTFSLAISV